MAGTREMLNELMAREARALGVWQYGFVPTAEIAFLDVVRGYCEENRCRKYGTTWACPPAVGTIEECRDKCRSYDTMLVMTGKYDLEDSFDFEGMQRGHAEFKEVCERVAELLGPRLGGDFFLLSNESCDKCESCTYPDAPCRFPETLHPSLEGYGIMVSDLAKQAGIKYINGKDTVTYFGGMLFREGA